VAVEPHPAAEAVGADLAELIGVAFGGV